MDIRAAVRQVQESLAIDTDGDNLLSKSEYLTTMRRAGAVESTTTRFTDRWFSASDQNGDSRLSVNELAAYTMLQQKYGDERGSAMVAFSSEADFQQAKSEIRNNFNLINSSSSSHDASTSGSNESVLKKLLPIILLLLFGVGD
jgi:hypothetical protein